MKTLQDETVDDLRLGGLKVIQKKDGYRFSLDPILLCDFTRVREAARVADLGTGSGVIPLVLARKYPTIKIVGLEIQTGLAQRAQRSVTLNGLEQQVEIFCGDLRALPSSFGAESFDLVVSNPPYRKPGSGKMAPQDERAMARHELVGGLDDFLKAAAFLLRSGGLVSIIYLPERLAELLSLLRQLRLEPKRLRCIHSASDEPARLIMVEGRKNGQPGMAVEPPLFIYDGKGYSKEVLRIYGER